MIKKIVGNKYRTDQLQVISLTHCRRELNSLTWHWYASSTCSTQKRTQGKCQGNSFQHIHTRTCKLRVGGAHAHTYVLARLQIALTCTMSLSDKTFAFEDMDTYTPVHLYLTHAHVHVLLKCE